MSKLPDKKLDKFEYSFGDQQNDYQIANNWVGTNIDAAIFKETAETGVPEDEEIKSEATRSKKEEKS